MSQRPLTVNAALHSLRRWTCRMAQFATEVRKVDAPVDQLSVAFSLLMRGGMFCIPNVLKAVKGASPQVYFT